MARSARLVVSVSSLMVISLLAMALLSMATGCGGSGTHQGQRRRPVSSNAIADLIRSAHACSLCAKDRHGQLDVRVLTERRAADGAITAGDNPVWRCFCLRIGDPR